jgi:DNA polymerase III delta prime subunit
MYKPIIFLTQTFVDQDIILNDILVNFIVNENLREFIKKPITFTNQSKVDFQNLIQNGRLVYPKLDSKEDFTSLISSFYQHHSQSTLLFLGDLSQYSLQLQESMLRLLEEPPSKVIIILLAQAKQNILNTIKSRCRLYILPKKYLIQKLDTSLLEKTKNKLPLPGVITKKLLNNELYRGEIPDLKNVEREELEFWLWQIQSYLLEYYKIKPDYFIAQKIEKVAQSIKFNNANMQKKFCMNTLFNN